MDIQEAIRLTMIGSQLLSEGNMKEGFERIKQAAEFGYERAQFVLGKCYFRGHGTRKNLKSAWNNDGTTIKEAIKNAAGEYKKLHKKAVDFSTDLFERAKKAGGKKYAELVSGAYRQVIGAHKVAIDENGEMLFISKECFSNGCASTVDVSYPSIPLFLVYNPEFVKGMLRQVYKFVSTDKWKFDFAPHDVGQYPLLNGQVYGLNRETNELSINSQMPVEESGNMIIMETLS